MYGWKGKILHINLTERTHHIEHPSTDIYQKYIGGKGLAGYYLKGFIREKYSSPGMPLIFMTGPLCNTLAPASGRMTIMSRSPLTGTVGDASVGGKLASQIKKAGFDGIIITGKSSSLSGIKIFNSSIEIVKTPEMTQLTTDKISDILGNKGSNTVIGPAAENGVLFSSIIVDRHFTAGRNGLGLVMASKNLKFIKVQGTEKTEIYSKDTLKKAREDIFRLTSASPVLTGELGISNYGTGALYDLISNRRMMPTDNFNKTVFHCADKMNAWHYKQKYGYKKNGCRGCHILCKKITNNDKAVPEFETMSHFSALIGNNITETVLEANQLCNDYGIDTISTAATLACYSEISEKTLTSNEVLKNIYDIAYSKNIGSELKLGSHRFAEKYLQADCSMTVKKQEIPGYDPRGAYGMALAYVTSTRGACHLRAYPISHEILRKPVVTDRFSFSGKARIIKISEDIFSVVDSLTSCKFLFFAASLEEYAKAFYGATGFKISAQDLMKCGERIYYNERIMNSWNGFTSEDDILPERFFTGSGSSGEGLKIPPINKKDFLEARSNYYKIRGLSEQGLPTESKAKELGLILSHKSTKTQRK